MHTVELLDEALLLAEQLGFRVRQEWLGGSGGGPCEIKGQKWLFLDLATTASEQLEHVVAAIGGLPEGRGATISPPLRRLLIKSKPASKAA